jgi:D-sedoheptulose 7-phosphate isomerase
LAHFCLLYNIKIFNNKTVIDYFSEYISFQKKALESIPKETLAEVIGLFKAALNEERQIFVFGNGGSGSNASHFVTDLGKSSSDKTHKRFRCMCLNDNTGWMTAIGNDYCFEDIFVRQLMNFARPGDLAMVLSVSGDSPNLVKAIEWAKNNQLHNIALVGGKKGKLAELADTVMVIDDTHYGRVEDAQMGICHMICYAFIEKEDLQKP